MSNYSKQPGVVEGWTDRSVRTYMWSQCYGHRDEQGYTVWTHHCSHCYTAWWLQ